MKVLIACAMIGTTSNTKESAYAKKNTLSSN